MEHDKKYPVRQNLAYCIRATRQGCPRLLVFGLLVILANCLLPVITAWLPKVVIEGITDRKPLQQLLLVTAAMTVALAVVSGMQKYLDRLEAFYPVRDDRNSERTYQILCRMQGKTGRTQDPDERK